MKYIDVHCHIFPESIAGKVVKNLEEYYGFPWEGNGLIGDLLASMDEAEITRSVIFSSATKPEQVPVINDYIASLTEKYPDRFIGFGTLHQDFKEFRSEIRRIRSLGLKGLKFHPDFQRFNIDDPHMMEVYREVGDSLVMLFHTGDKKTDFSTPQRMAHVLDEIPDLRIVAAHMGGYSVWEESQKYLVGRNVWMDISSTTTTGMVGIEEIRKMILAHGIDKVLYATDYPGARHARMIRETLKFGFSQEENEKLFFRNAENLLGITL